MKEKYLCKMYRLGFIISVKQKIMMQLHSIPNNQQRWNKVPSNFGSIGLLTNSGDTCVLFIRESEFINKRPEDILMQEQ